MQKCRRTGLSNLFGALVEGKEDVVQRQRGDDVEDEPLSEVRFGYERGIQDYIVRHALLHEACRAQYQKNVIRLFSLEQIRLFGLVEMICWFTWKRPRC